MRVQNKVERLLQSRQDFRDSDKKLLMAVWHIEGLQLTEDQRKIFLTKCSTAESVTRSRRKLKVKYPPSKDIDDERYRKFKDYRGGDIY
jgi:hypothetical protein